MARPIPRTQFGVSVEINNSTMSLYQCPVGPPAWLQNLATHGVSLNLFDVINSAGMHYSDVVFGGQFGSVKNAWDKCAEKAWSTIDNLRPRVLGGHLVVDEIRDGDLRSDASHIIGIGAGLSLLKSQNLIDVRTLKKRFGRFDYTAYGPGGFGKLYIEVKGTSNLASLDDHRSSIRDKIIRPKNPKFRLRRGYDRAIGIIFSTWSQQELQNKKFDFEILDPEYPNRKALFSSFRRILMYYAHRLGEDVGKKDGSIMLKTLSRCESPMEFEVISSRLGIDSLSRGRLQSVSRYFWRASVAVSFGVNRVDYVGSYWKSSFVKNSLTISGLMEEGEFPYAFVGIDKNVLIDIFDGEYESVVNYSSRAVEFKIVEGKFSGIVTISADGILRLFFNDIDAFPGEICLDSKIL